MKKNSSQDKPRYNVSGDKSTSKTPNTQRWEQERTDRNKK